MIIHLRCSTGTDKWGLLSRIRPLGESDAGRQLGKDEGFLEVLNLVVAGSKAPFVACGSSPPHGLGGRWARRFGMIYE